MVDTSHKEEEIEKIRPGAELEEEDLLSPELREQMHEAISTGQWQLVRGMCRLLPPPVIAELLGELPKDEHVLMYRLLERELAADVFSYLEEENQEKLLRELTDHETSQLLENMNPDDRTMFLEELPAAALKRLMGLLDPEDLKEARQLLGYPEGSVGRRMTPLYVNVSEEMTITEALASIRAQAKDSETLNMIYVTDKNGRLVDDLRLRAFIMAEPESLVRDLLDGVHHALSAFDPQEKAVSMMRELDYFALPVTDSKGSLIGIITADDVLDVAEEEATEDIHKSAAMGLIEGDYKRAPIWMIYMRRVSWLVLLIFVNILSGAGIAAHEELIESMVALVFFLPLLIACGGNAGAQASTLIIRAMALDQVRNRDYWYLLLKEAITSVALGLTMALVVSMVAWWRSGYEVAVVVTISMMSIVLVGNFIGMSLPFLLRRFKMDPATASGPLVTSFADIVGVLIYLGIAQAMLSNLG